MPVTEKFIDNEHVVEINTSTWNAEVVVSNNANLIKLRQLESELDILRTPDSLETLRELPECYGMPLLFPLGRIAGAGYCWNGREYKFPLNDPDNNCNLHGLIPGQPWFFDGIDESGNKTIMTLSFTHDRQKDSFKGYPHEFKLILRYIFTPDAVVQRSEVHNQSDKPMPFGLGFHSAFNLPEATSRLMVTTGAEYYEISQATKVPTGRRLPLPEALDYRQPGGRQPGQHAAGVLTTIQPMNDLRGAVIHHPEAMVTYEVDESYNFWALWNEGGGKGFFCVEPLTCLSNAPNLDLPPSESGLQILQPGQSWTGSAQVGVKIKRSLPSN